MGYSAFVSSCYDLDEVEVFGSPEQNKGLEHCAGVFAKSVGPWIRQCELCVWIGQEKGISL